MTTEASSHIIPAPRMFTVFICEIHPGIDRASLFQAIKSVLRFTEEWIDEIDVNAKTVKLLEAPKDIAETRAHLLLQSLLRKVDHASLEGRDGENLFKIGVKAND